MKMGKRVLSAVLSVCLLLGSVPAYATEAKAEPEDNSEYIEDSFMDNEQNHAPQSAVSSSSATSGQCGDNVYWSFDEATGTLTISGTGEMWNFSWTGSNAMPWVGLKDSIMAVDIKDGVTSVGSLAFYEFTSIASVTIPGSVSIIRDAAFRGCSNLVDLEIAYGVVEIEQEVFWWCTSLETVVLPDSVEKIGYRVFRNCSSLASITVPGSVESMGGDMFSGCMIQSSGPVGGGYDYEYGWASTIPHNAFSGLSSLNKVYVPESITTIQSNAFDGCTGITSAGPIGSGYDYEFGWKTSIPDNAFYLCEALSVVELPETIQSIGDKAFSGCSSLAELKLPDSVYEIGSDAFSGCAFAYVDLPENLTTIADGLFNNCAQLTGINMPNITSIGSHAFQNCVNLSSILIPSTVTDVGTMVFMGCDSLVTAGPVGEGYDIEIALTNAIPENMFSYCDSLETIVIPAGITSIGRSSFYSCDNLSSISIPGSVVSIASGAFLDCDNLKSAGPTGGNFNFEFGWVNEIPERAFAGCESLYSVDLPDSLNAIGSSAFSGCISLQSINIPANVTSIGSGAFYQCSALKTMILPEGITRIERNLLYECSSLSYIYIPKNISYVGLSAFYGCDSLISAGPAGTGKSVEYGWTEEIPMNAFADMSCLQDVNIADGIKLIGRGAFENCSSLNSIEFPASIESIDWWAFDGSALTSAKFHGNAPACNDVDSLAPFPSTTTVYYIAGTTGWTNGEDYNEEAGTWKGYKLAVWDPEAESLKPEISDIPKDKYLIHVVDSDGNGLLGAEVVYDGRTQYTDINGNVLFDSLTIGTPTITVSLAGYETWTNENSSWEKSESRYETIVLYSEAEGAYKLDEALYSSSVDMSYPCNLLIQTKTVSKLNTGNLVGDFGLGTFFISCRAIEENYVNVYQLWQGEKMIAENSEGFFELNVDSFEKGGDCFIRVIATDGTEVDSGINLQIDENDINKNSSIEISKGTISLKVDDDVPFIGGQNVDINLPNELPIDFEFTDTKVHIGFNLKKFDSSDTNKEKEDKWDSMKGTLEALAEARKIELSGKDKEKLENLIKNNKSVQLPGTGSLTAYVLGYAEADWGSSVAEGALYLIVSYSTRTFDFNTVVAVVPVTVQVKASASVTFGGDVSYNWAENTFDSGINLDVTVGLNAFGGVGVGKLVGVGAYGDGKLLVESQLKGPNTGVENVDLTGELGLKAYVAWFTYERAFAHRTWHVYTQNNTRAVSSMSANSMGIYLASNYAVEALDYLANESDWMGYPVSTFALGASTAFNTLLAGTYRNAQPAMISNGEQLYAAFLKADSNTNKISVAISVFNGSGWSEPIISDINGILDDGPQLLSADGSVWLTYASTGASADSSSMVSYATNQTIVIGSVDSNGNFDEFSRYTPSASTYSHMQTLAVVNGAPTLFWVESAIEDADDIFTSTSNTVKYAVYSNGSWGNAQTLSTINHPIRQLTAGGGSVACNIDTDDNLNTTDDLQLTVYAISGSSSVIANGVTGNVTYGVLPGTSVEGFIWNGDGTLYCDSSSIAAPGITNEYSIVGDSIYYSSTDEGGTVLTLLKYDGANWSEPISLISSADESRYFENLSAAELNGKDYIFGMNTAVDISADSVTPDKNLVWASVDPVSDLRIDGVEYDTDVVTPGENVPVTLTVVNGGDHAVSELQVTVDGVAQDIETMDLGVGESADITINIPCPNVETAYNINVTATNESLADDFTPDDNSYQIVLGLANLVANLTYEQIGTSRTLVAAVTNEGINPASGTVTFYDANGAAHGETAFSDLESGGVVVVRLPLADSFAGKYDGGDVSVTATSEQSELYEFDNRATAHLYESTGTDITSVESSGSYVEAQVTYYGEQTGVTAYCAFYDAQGRMLSTEQQALIAGTQSLRFSRVTNAATAKVFILDMTHNPLCQAKEVTL